MTMFRGTLGFFFECSHAKSGTGLCIEKHRFFLVLISTVLRHSILFCAILHFGTVLRGTTLRSWWKHVFIFYAGRYIIQAFLIISSALRILFKQQDAVHLIQGVKSSLYYYRKLSTALPAMAATKY